MGFLDSEGLRHLVGKIKAMIPSKTSQLVNDAGFLTANQDFSIYALKDNPEFTGSISLGRRKQDSIAVGTGSLVLGYMSHAQGNYAHVFGIWCGADGFCASASGNNCYASGAAAHSFGRNTLASGTNQTAIGAWNVESTEETDKLIVGKGENTGVRANCFRVTHTGVYATGAHKTTGADYAELFEWSDGNPTHIDRCGLFATLDGGKIRLAGPEDDFILGIVSGNPSVVGDVHDDQWQGMFLTDVFGRPIFEDVEVPAELGPNGEVVIPAHTEHRQKVNPAYDHEEAYLPRSQRPEWDAVGMLGKLVMVDDGTCHINGWCTPGEGGIATHSDVQTRYRVMARLDENHVRVLIL